MRASSPSVWARFVLSIKIHWQLILYCLAGILFRIWNFRNSLYFIYDQGRDAWVLEKMAHGDFVLVGPTSGLQGFFLGPLWYYLGVPGYWLSQGNPFGMNVWYILLSCVSLPLAWWLSHRLFNNRWWAVISALLLSFTPGPVIASLTVWNPLIAAPLLLAFVFALDRSLAGGKWRLAWLATAYLLLGFTLHSEFAYAIFLIGPGVLAYPWLRGKVERPQVFKELAIIAAAMAITFVPQVLFDFRNQHLLSKSLLFGLQDHSRTVSWEYMLENRPYHLWGKTSDLLIGDGETRNKLLPFIFASLGIGTATIAWHLRKRFPKFSVDDRLWTIVLCGVILPYIGFSLWRGNDGNFFFYYLTPHYIFLLPLITRGLQKIVDEATLIKLKPLGIAIVAGILTMFAIRSFNFWQASVNTTTNNAGMAKMVDAVDQVYDWRQSANPTTPFVTRVFTANFLTENYDYLLEWRAAQRNMPVPEKQRNPAEQEWYVLIESRPAEDNQFFQPWYYEATKGGTLRDRTQHGVVTVEKWSR